MKEALCLTCDELAVVSGACAHQILTNHSSLGKAAMK